MTANRSDIDLTMSKRADAGGVPRPSRLSLEIGSLTLWLADALKDAPAVRISALTLAEHARRLRHAYVDQLAHGPATRQTHDAHHLTEHIGRVALVADGLYRTPSWQAQDLYTLHAALTMLHTHAANTLGHD